MVTRPHGLLRAGYPYHKTLGMRRVTNFPADICFGENDKLYILMRSEGVASVRIWSRFEDAIGDMTPTNVRLCKEHKLRAVGLSRRKVSYIFALR